MACMPAWPCCRNIWIPNTRYVRGVVLVVLVVVVVVVDDNGVVVMKGGDEGR